MTKRNVVINIKMVRRRFIRFYKKIKSLKSNKYIRGKSLSCISRDLYEEL